MSLTLSLTGADDLAVSSQSGDKLNEDWLNTLQQYSTVSALQLSAVCIKAISDGGNHPLHFILE